MKLRPFELVLVVVFGGLALLSLFLMANYSPDTSDEDVMLQQVGMVNVWGTLPAAAIDGALVDLIEENELYRNIIYRYINPRSFEETLRDALADQAGPDIILVSHEKLVNLRKWIQPISYENFSARDITNNYIDGAQIFALSDGLYGFPIAVDPLVLYWNKDLLTTKGYLKAPSTWETLINEMFPELIMRNDQRIINRSVVAMGEYGNVRNAYGVISALLTQGGSAGVVEVDDNKYLVKLRTTLGGDSDPLQSALDFYTRFSKPSNILYSWNRSFGEDRQQFVSEKLAFYFGYGSEGYEIEQINPNLNFDIAELPQGASATTRRTYGKFYAFSMLKSSKNQAGAGVILSKLSSANVANKIAVLSAMAPVDRTSVSVGSNDIYGRVIFRSAPIAFGWLNPDIEVTENIFETMVKDVNENRAGVLGAASDASGRITKAF